MKLTLTIDVTGEDLIRLGQNSIERVLNNAINVGGEIEKPGPVLINEALAENASTLWQDCEELKPLVCKLWNGAQAAVWEAKAKAGTGKG